MIYIFGRVFAKKKRERALWPEKAEKCEIQYPTEQKGVAILFPNFWPFFSILPWFSLMLYETKLLSSSNKSQLALIVVVGFFVLCKKKVSVKAVPLCFFPLLCNKTTLSYILLLLHIALKNHLQGFGLPSFCTLFNDLITTQDEGKKTVPLCTSHKHTREKDFIVMGFAACTSTLTPQETITRENNCYITDQKLYTTTLPFLMGNNVALLQNIYCYFFWFESYICWKSHDFNIFSCWLDNWLNFLLVHKKNIWKSFL